MNEDKKNFTIGIIVLILIIIVIIVIGLWIGGIFSPSDNICNTTSCNNVMSDWINNKYWAFSDSAKSFAECKNCASRWFKAPFQSSIDGTKWIANTNKESVYNAVKLV